MDFGARASMPRDVRLPGEDRLDSWKEIAEYLKRSVRTVRRWEAEEGLPVHRHVHQNSGTVYAFKAELDVWLVSRSRDVTRPQPDQPRPQEIADSSKAPKSSLSIVWRRWVIVGTLVTVLLGIAGLWQVRGRPRDTPTPIRSLAVLPLANLTGDPAQEYIAAGMTDALITELAQTSGCRVISRMSVIHYGGVTPTRVQDVARELNVDAIVEGAIVRFGSRLQITAKLIDARTDTHVWARSYERDFNDLENLPRELARSIAEAVAGKLNPLSAARRDEPRQTAPAAYRLFFQSVVAASGQTYEGYQDGISYCQQAIDKDPTFAAAYARMGVYYLQFSFVGKLKPRQFMPQAEAAARRAIELDDTIAEGHAVLAAVLHRFRWDWAASDHEYRRALTLNPNYAEAHRMYSVFLASMNRTTEAITEALRARDLDPLSLQAMLNLGQAYRAAGQIDAAIELFRSGLLKNPNRAQTHFYLGNTYVQKGMLRDGITQLQVAVDGAPHNPVFLSSLAYAYARSGRTSEARKILADLQELADHQYVSPSAIARVYVGLDDKLAAHTWIEKAYLERDLNLISLNADVGLAELRSDPAFQDVIPRVGFTL
jgi:TolB-like protein/Flp pilus assembly protein TadD